MYVRQLTREERKRRQETAIYIGNAIILSLFLALVILLLHSYDAEPEPSDGRELEARYYAAWEYDRLRSDGVSEWSAEQAAKQKYEEVMGDGETD